MIIITRKAKDAKEIVINAELIETVEETPDTIITLINGKKIMVKETAREIVELVRNYKKSILI